MSDIRGVLFDFDGTLARCVPPWPEKHSSVLARHGLAGLAEAWGDQWEIGPADGESHAEHSSNEAAYRRWELERLRVRARACAVPAPLLEPLVADLDRATKGVVMAAYGDAPVVLGQLRQRGLLVGVCSNWYWDLDRELEAVGLRGAVDVAVTSAQAGARKPHPRIYAQALAACGLAASEVLFVGDRWSTDVAGPRAAGMPALLLCRQGLPPGLAQQAGGGWIEDLHALPALLDAGWTGAGGG